MICTVCKTKEQAPGKSGKCVECRNRYNREHYAKNKEKALARAKANKMRTREWLQKIKAKTPCADCGVNYPYYVMDFDHRENKEFNLSKAVGTCGRDKIEQELAKCDVVCANCHRERSQKRLMCL